MTEPIGVTVKPRSTRVGVSLEGEEVIVRVHAPAAEGQANKECLELLAAAVGVPKSAFSIVRGAKRRCKQIAVDGLTAAEVRGKLARREERSAG